MSREDKMELRRKAKFLEDIGYTVKEDEYGLAYDSADIRFYFGYERYDEEATALMWFKLLRECFDIGWITLVRENLNLENMDRKKALLLYTSFTKANYDKLMDIRYCRESDTLIDAYIERRLAEK